MNDLDFADILSRLSLTEHAYLDELGVKPDDLTALISRNDVYGVENYLAEAAAQKSGTENVDK